ncbi:hypothetical protein UlMin_037111 [Ulmus minor]
MDNFRQLSDSHYILESTDKPESSSLSTDSAATISKTSYSDEEVILASNRPKKRAGRRVFKETRHPIYRGVRRRNTNKWVCEVREPNKKTRIWLGTYPTADMAARAHDVAALAFRGKSACLNFADSAWRLPVPVSNDAKDIQVAAAEAAEAFRPSEHGENDENLVEKEEKMEENNKTSSMFSLDEEVFDMPSLFVDMAQGLLLPPPPSNDLSLDDMEYYDDVSLWSYSI